MIKRFVTAGLLVLGTMATGSVFAQTCPGGTIRITGGAAGNPTSNGNFTSFVTGATFCAARASDRWQEFHRADTALIDWKLGSNPIDPTEQVGTWSAQNGANATVTHTYGSTSYVWAVCLVAAALPTPPVTLSTLNYTLVSTTAGTITNARILAGQVPCP